VLGNHDKPRIASAGRAGAGARRGHAAAHAARHAHLYYGDEIGMQDVRDPAGPGAGPLQALNLPGRGWAGTELRRREPALQVGDYAPSCIHGDAFAFTREHDGRRFLIALNLGDAPATLRPDNPARGTIRVGTDRRREGDRVDGGIELAASEGVVVELGA
jgi:glycosidase